MAEESPTCKSRTNLEIVSQTLEQSKEQCKQKVLEVFSYGFWAEEELVGLSSRDGLATGLME